MHSSERLERSHLHTLLLLCAPAGFTHESEPKPMQGHDLVDGQRSLLLSMEEESFDEGF